MFPGTNEYNVILEDFLWQARLVQLKSGIGRVRSGGSAINRQKAPCEPALRNLWPLPGRKIPGKRKLL